MTNVDDLIAEAVRLCNAATVGPWLHDLDPIPETVSYAIFSGTNFFSDDAQDVAEGMAEEDAEFTARSRTIVPALVAEVTRLQTELTDQAAVIEAVREWRDWTCNLLLGEEDQIDWAGIDAIVPRTDSTSTEGTQ